MPVGVNASKVNAYAVTSPSAGVNVSKVNAYAITAPPQNVNVSKVVVYGIVSPLPSGGSIFQGAGGNAAAKFRCCTDGHDVQLALMARKLERQHANKAAYPYVWLEPPEDAIPVNAIADIPSPAPNAQTVVLAYQVPSGFRFWLHGALMDYQGGALNPGDALWTADQNDSQVNVQGSGVQGLIGIPFLLGSVLHGRWWRFYMPFSFEPLTVLRSKVTNINLGVGPPGVFTSGFFGYLVPVEE